MSTHVLTNGFYFDLGVLTLAAIIVGTHSGWRWLTRRRRPAQPKLKVPGYCDVCDYHYSEHVGYWKSIYDHEYVEPQHLVEDQRPSVFPRGTHEGDWDWPRRSERDRLLRSGQ
jgi:hypothetical protein